MWIFKKITESYFSKLLNAYQSQADEKMYTGKEAELLILRNDYARCLVESIKKIKITPEQEGINYFKLVIEEINQSLKNVSEEVIEHNNQNNTAFTTDLYQTFFTPSLISFINIVDNLYQTSPPIIANLKDESLFCNNRNVPWIYQFSFVIYDYILEKELDLMLNKSDRDIFNAKKLLGIKYVQSAAELHSLYEGKNDNEYRKLMNILLKGMSSEEQDLQQRKTPDNTAPNMYSYFTQSFYKASEQIMGKGQLGLLIDNLIKEYNERSLINQPSVTTVNCI
jgi:hypothetical protein